MEIERIIILSRVVVRITFLNVLEAGSTLPGSQEKPEKCRPWLPHSGFPQPADGTCPSVGDVHDPEYLAQQELTAQVWGPYTSPTMAWALHCRLTKCMCVCRAPQCSGRAWSCYHSTLKSGCCQRSGGKISGDTPHHSRMDPRQMHMALTLCSSLVGGKQPQFRIFSEMLKTGGKLIKI